MMEGASKIVMAPNGNGALFDAVLKNLEVSHILREIDYV
jgi:UDP-N-acetylglucosamine pyrophosphorylase